MDIMGKTFFVLKIVAVFKKCKAQLYLIGTFLSQKEKGKTLLGFKPKSIGNLGHHFFTLQQSLDLHPYIFYFLVLCREAFFSLLFLANFHHLATKKSSANHTKEFCEKNAPKSPYFKGICFRKSPYIGYGFQQVATKLWRINFSSFLSYLQIWLILVIDDCQCGLHKKLAKTNKFFASQVLSQQ
jgi:hypothetical protein